MFLSLLKVYMDEAMKELKMGLERIKMKFSEEEKDENQLG